MNKDFIYDPYFQMALGIMGGNTGVNRSDAWANAMRGGFSAATQATEAKRLQEQLLEQQKLNKIKTDEYERLKITEENLRKFGAGLKKQGGLVGELGAFIEQDPEAGMKMFEGLNKARYYQSLGNSYGGGGGGGSSDPFMKGMPNDMKIFMLEGAPGAKEKGMEQAFIDWNIQRRASPENLTVEDMKSLVKGAVAEAFGDDGAYSSLEPGDRAHLLNTARMAQSRKQDVFSTLRTESLKLRDKYSSSTSVRLPIIGDIPTGNTGIGSYKRKKETGPTGEWTVREKK